MWSITFMVISHEVEKLPFSTSLRLDLSKEERSEGKALHKAIEKLANLVGLPYEFTLYSGEHRSFLLDMSECVPKRPAGFVQLTSPIKCTFGRLPVPRAGGRHRLVFGRP